MSTKKGGRFGMKNIDSIFDFYLKNKLSFEKDEESKKVFASMIALANYSKEKNFNLSTVIKMIILENADIDKLTNQKEIKNVLDEFHNLKTNESIEAQKSLETAKKLNPCGIEEELEHIYGRLLISVGIDLESKIQLDFTRLYEIVIKITEKELQELKDSNLEGEIADTYNVYKVERNITGYPVLRCKESSEHLWYECAEELDENLDIDNTSVGYGEQRQRYFAITDGVGELYHPYFTWHGFQYFAVSNNCEVAEVRVIHTDMDVTSSTVEDKDWNIP